jgi:hypothetical protein
MSYTAPVKDMLFNMKHLAASTSGADARFRGRRARHGAGRAGGVRQVQRGRVAPLNWEGDKNPSSFKDGVVTTTPGFKEAFRSSPKAAGRACSTRWTSAARACPRPSARPAARCSTAPT